MEHYKCLVEICKQEWVGPVGPNSCPKCRSKSVEWVSFKEWDYDGECWTKKEQN